MSLESYCANPVCKRRHLLPDTATGKSVRCKGCGQTFVAGASVTMYAAKSEDVIEPAWNEPTKTSATAPGAASTVGTTVGRFAIRGKLGTGAFGTVYRAYDPQLDRVVALKVPNPGVMTDAKRAERFLREAKAAANLRHPHIVPVFDAGKDGDTYYIASAFIEGQPLADSIPEKGVEFERAARIVRELAEALAYAHEQGIVHRDVKPANIMIDTHDRVHLMDFGLASRQEEAARLTNDGAVMGTPAYMSPEQAKGQKGEAKPATDQYAAGVVLYELLTGTVPFSGPLAVVLHNVIHTDPEPPHNHRPDVPKDVETICLKAMAKRPEDRYVSCQELADDLRRWLEDEPVTARPLRPWERATRWVKKEPKLAISATVVALVLLISVALVSNAARRAERDAAEARAAEKRAEVALSEAKAAREREEQAVGATSGALGTASQERKRAETFQTQAANDRKKAETFQAQAADDRKKAETFQAQAADDRKKAEALRALLGADKYALQYAYSAHQDGRTDDAKTLLEMVPVQRRGWEWRHVRLLLSSPDETGALRKWPSTARSDRGKMYFSQDGTRVIINGTTQVLDAQSGKKLCDLEVQAGTSPAVAFSPDGTRVVTASDTTARIWDAQTGKELLVLNRHPEAIRAVAFSPDGARVVTASDDKTARIWNANTAEEPLVLRGHTFSLYAAAFSPDGARVVTTGGDGTARLWDASSGKELFSFKSHERSPAAFSPDGAQVVTADYATAYVWDTKTGKELFALNHKRDASAFKGGHVVAAFSPSGAWVVTADADTTQLWDAKTGKEGPALKGAGGGQVAVSPDGARLVAVGQDRRLRVWDTASGEALVVIELSSHVVSVAWSPDGARLISLREDGTVEVRDGGPAPKP